MQLGTGVILIELQALSLGPCVSSLLRVSLLHFVIFVINELKRCC